MTQGMPDYAALIARSDAFLALKRDADAGAVAHAYLLNAPDALAGALTARLFAAYCLSGGTDTADAQLIYAQKHPDVCEFPGIGANGKPRDAVTVADADAIVSGIYIRPSRGDQKFYLIYNAESMNRQSQNKLLKTLEDPPAGVRIVLCSRVAGALLPTVISRCKTLEVRQFPIAAIQDELDRRYPADERTAPAAALSCGSLAAAQEFMTDAKALGLFYKCRDVLLQTRSSKDVLDGVTALSGLKADANRILDFFELILRDVLVYHAGRADLAALRQSADTVEPLAALYSAAAIERLLPFLGKLRRRVRLNANPVSLTDELLFTVAEYRIKYKET